MSKPLQPVIYQFKVVLRRISPMIWRRLLIRNDSSVADLHHFLQISFGWSDFHLHRFLIYGKQFGVYRTGGPVFDEDAEKVRLSDFRFRIRERFLYEYDFGDNWQHDITLEKILLAEPKGIYPTCIAGKRSAPPEDCGGPWQFIKTKQESPLLSFKLVEDIQEAAKERDMAAIEDLVEQVQEVLPWLSLGRFDRRAVNRRLQQYTAGDPQWMEEP